MNLGISELVILFSIIVLLVFVTTLIASIGLRLSRRLGSPPATPLEILQTRYARGEIDRAQYEQMKRDLT